MSDDEVTFYYNPNSRARIVHWMLEEAGAPYRIEFIRFEPREQKADAYLAINPMGKLPTIVHRGVVITETGAICTYLADAFPAAGLAPALDDPRRGTYYRWLYFGAGCVEPAIVDRLLGRPPAERPGQVGYGTYDDTFKTLEQALTPGPFLLGDMFSTADVYVGSQLGWGTMMKAIDPRPAFAAYHERLSQRPAFKRFAQQAATYAQELAAKR